MPEVWVTKTQKYKYCSWPNKEISDQFQATVLKKLFEQYKLSDMNVADTHQVSAQKRKENKK